MDFVHDNKILTLPDLEIYNNKVERSPLNIIKVQCRESRDTRLSRRW